MISQTQLNSYWHNKYIVLTYTIKWDLFSMIIIIMFYCDCESLKLCNFSLELSETLYLQTVQINTICVLS